MGEGEQDLRRQFGSEEELAVLVWLELRDYGTLDELRGWKEYLYTHIPLLMDAATPLFFKPVQIWFGAESRE